VLKAFLPPLAWKFQYKQTSRSNEAGLTPWTLLNSKLLLLQAHFFRMECANPISNVSSRIKMSFYFLKALLSPFTLRLCVSPFQIPKDSQGLLARHCLRPTVQDQR
jgi:hypothetical protein